MEPNLPSEEKEAIPRLRTLASDLGESMQGRKGVTIHDAIAEEGAREEAQAKLAEEPKKNLIMLIASAGLIVLGIASVFIFSFFNRVQPVAVQNSTAVRSLIFADTSKEIAVDGLDREKLVQAIKDEVSAAAVGEGKIENIYFTHVENGMKYVAGSRVLFSALGFQAPELLTDTLGNTFMFGIYGSKGNRPFLLLQTASYSDAFAGMQSWEARLYDDFYQIDAINPTGDNANLFTARFEDATLGNKNARVIRNGAGAIALFYVFINDQTIIIATDAATLAEVSERLTAQKVEQQ